MIRHGWLIVLLVFLFSACGRKHDATRWDSFPVALYADTAIGNGASSAYDLSDAMDFWEVKAGKKLFYYKGQWDGIPYAGDPQNPTAIYANMIFLQRPWTFAGNIAGKTVVLSADKEIHSSIIMINPNISFCSGDCKGQEARVSRRKTFAHELGHFLGLQHVDDPSNIMYPDMLPGGSLDGLQVDMKALAELTE